MCNIICKSKEKHTIKAGSMPHQTTFMLQYPEEEEEEVTGASIIANPTNTGIRDRLLRTTQQIINTLCYTFVINNKYLCLQAQYPSFAMKNIYLLRINLCIRYCKRKRKQQKRGIILRVEIL